MKHTDWLRLQTEGENICSTLRQQDYQCLKQRAIAFPLPCYLAIAFAKPLFESQKPATKSLLATHFFRDCLQPVLEAHLEVILILQAQIQVPASRFEAVQVGH